MCKRRCKMQVDQLQTRRGLIGARAVLREVRGCVDGTGGLVSRDDAKTIAAAVVGAAARCVATGLQNLDKPEQHARLTWEAQASWVLGFRVARALGACMMRCLEVEGRGRASPCTQVASEIDAIISGVQNISMDAIQRESSLQPLRILLRRLGA